MRRLGDRACLFPRPLRVPAKVLLDRVRAWPTVVDVVIVEKHFAAYFSADPSIDDAMISALAVPATAGPMVGKEHVLSVVYDGEDLLEIAARSRINQREVIERHTAVTYEVAMMGFQPGFAYLTGIDPVLVHPRRPMPRANVDAGAVAIAGRYSGVYPHASPGGWNLIGRLANGEMFDAESGPRLTLGDRVRFVESVELHATAEEK